MRVDEHDNGIPWPAGLEPVEAETKSRVGNRLRWYALRHMLKRTAPGDPIKLIDADAEYAGQVMDAKEHPWRGVGRKVIAASVLMLGTALFGAGLGLYLKSASASAAPADWWYGPVGMALIIIGYTLTLVKAWGEATPE